MINAPPLEAPSSQEIPIYLSVVTDALFAKLIGASGILEHKIVTDYEKLEYPIRFLAYT